MSSSSSKSNIVSGGNVLVVIALAAIVSSLSLQLSSSRPIISMADAFHYKNLLHQRRRTTSEISFHTNQSRSKKHSQRRNWHVSNVPGTTCASPLVVFYKDEQQSSTTSSSSSPSTTNCDRKVNNLLHAGDIKWIIPVGTAYHNYEQLTLDANGATGFATATAATTTMTNSSSVTLTRPRMRDHLSQLIAMTRPKNLPGVILFHMLGTWLTYQSVISSIQSKAAAAASTFVAVPAMSYWQLLVQPTMIVTLLALLLTSATSMLVNDYYDYKLGNDETKEHNLLSSTASLSPTSSAAYLPPILVKRFVSYLYAMALFCATTVPGIPARCTVVGGLMLTFWYTQHLKPRTWLKNFVCGGLIAASPLTSSMAALAWLTQRYGVISTFQSQMTLLRLFAVVFIGIVGREMTMDINDIEDDEKHGVRTVPVVYGRRFASTIAVLCSLCVLSLGVLGPLHDCVSLSTTGGREVVVRRLAMAALGGLAQLRRSWQVLETEGRDADIVDVAVNEGLLTVIIIMASFV